MEKTIRLFVLAALGVMAAGCFHTQQDISEITIGAVYNLTGSQSDLDGPSAQGARAAVALINRKGGILGRRVVLSIVDGESQPRIVAEKTALLLEANPTMPAVIGLSDTDMVLAAAPVAARSKRVFLTSGATSPLLPQEVPEYLFLACFGDNVQAAVGAEWANTQLGARNAMILYNADSTYARLLQQYFRTRFEELGSRVLKVVPYTPAALDQLTIVPAEVDLIYLAATPDEVLPALAKLRQAGFSEPVLGGDGLDIGNAWQKGREFSDVFFTTHAYLGKDNEDPRIVRFRKEFGDIFPAAEPDAFTALGFDSVNLLAEAVVRAGRIDPEAVRKALASLSGFQGVTGTISYRSGSRIPTKSVTIVGVTHGKQSAVGTFAPAGTPHP
jgi:branched-chain amino acid transport system substrate-binding protein